MRFEILRHVRDHAKAVGPAHHLLLVIATHVNYHTGEARVSVKRLAHVHHRQGRCRKGLRIGKASLKVILNGMAGCIYCRVRGTTRLAIHAIRSADYRFSPQKMLTPSPSCISSPPVRERS